MGRRRATTHGPASTPDPQPEIDPTPKISLYEQSRENRIRENKERLQKLGIIELSDKLRSSAPRRTPQRRGSSSEDRPTPVLPPIPTRRSSRLQNVTPVSYAEVPLKKKEGGGSEDQVIVLEEGAKPEIYTEEHEKLLGSTERSWELFVDGYGKDGKRIYDPVKGKTCHQCRQKTLGHRTQCCKCNMVQGQFCGDCLKMRYGEHVLEALENPNWICPVCRGICNCSLCRQAKGWAPTGPLHRKVSRLGYKSVAHFLIQTRRAQTNEEETDDLVIHSSVKRSLPFSEIEETVTEEPLESNDNETRTSDGEIEGEEKESIHAHAKRSLAFSGKEAEETVDGEGNTSTGVLEPKVEGTPEQHKSDEDEPEVQVIDKENNAKPKRKYAISAEPGQDSIGGRLRQRRRMQNGSNASVV
ncbi:hypothetical protein CDL15_Pgr013513 [Punica granatum]|nr:hypothetical protein CDL15_Pgr013513 [Punica granatum]